MKNNLLQMNILIKNQIEMFFKNRKFIIFISIIFGLGLILNFIGLSSIKQNNEIEKMGEIDSLILSNCILLVLKAIYITKICFINQIKNNIYKIELRYGYRIKNVYYSRIIFTLGYLICYLILMFGISLIFFSATYQDENLTIYRLYVSSFGWYAILIFLTIVSSLIFSWLFSQTLANIFSTIMALFLIFLPLIGGVIINIRSTNNLPFYLMLLQEQYVSSLENSVKNNTLTNDIYNNFEGIIKDKENNQNENKVNNTNNFLGIKFWEIEDSTKSKYPNYVMFFQDVDQVFKNHKSITNWEDIWEFSNDFFYVQDEPINKIINKLLSFELMFKYKDVLQVMKKYTNNFGVLKDLELIKIPDKLLLLEEEVKKKFNNCDEYLFTRTLNALFIKILELKDLSENISKIIEDIDEIIAKDWRLNLLNPVRHFNLMFQSINYNNYALSNLMAKSFHVPNIKVYRDDMKAIHFKQNVSIELIYCFYFIIGCIVIILLFLAFKKKNLI